MGRGGAIVGAMIGGKGREDENVVDTWGFRLLLVLVLMVVIL